MDRMVREGFSEEVTFKEKEVIPVSLAGCRLWGHTELDTIEAT